MNDLNLQISFINIINEPNFYSVARSILSGIEFLHTFFVRKMFQVDTPSVRKMFQILMYCQLFCAFKIRQEFITNIVF